MTTEAKLDTVIARLEAVTQKLEKVGLGSGRGSPDEIPLFLEEYEKIQPQVSKIVALSKKIGGDVGPMADLFSKAFETSKQFLVLSVKTKKPSQTQMASVFSPLNNIITESQAFEKKSKDRDHLSHLQAFVGFMSAFTWITLPNRPAPFVKEMSDSGQYYTNRVLTQFKDKDAVHKEWVKEILQFLKSLENYVLDNHASGLQWNQNGAEPTAPSATAKTPAAVCSKPAVGSSNLFSELNKGGSVTSGLKKVDDSQKVHKNPELRAGSKVTATSSAAVKSSPASKPVNKPPVFELQGKKWAVENQIDQPVLEINDASISNILYMSNCHNTTLVINQKINSITMDCCVKSNIVMKCGIISSFDMINCKKCAVQADEHVPTISIAGSDDVNVHLPEKASKAEIVTSKSSGLNIHIISANGDEKEYPVPEQFLTKLINGKLVTSQIDHC